MEPKGLSVFNMLSLFVGIRGLTHSLSRLTHAEDYLHDWFLAVPEQHLSRSWNAAACESWALFQEAGSTNSEFKNKLRVDYVHAWVEKKAVIRGAQMPRLTTVTGK